MKQIEKFLLNMLGLGMTSNGVEHVMVPKALYDEWVAADDLALDWADANARWFSISTAPTKGMFLLWDNFNDDYEFGTAIQVAEDEYGRFTHWRPLPPPPSNPPLPEPLETLGDVLRRVKGVG